MRYSLIVVSAILFAMSSCKDDDTSWKQEIEGLKQELNVQKNLILALEQNSYIVGIQNYTDSYTILFSNGQSITLKNGQTPTVSIGDNGDWFINGVDTGKPSQGLSPSVSIGSDGHWYIDGEDTGVLAEGKSGANAPVIESVIINDNTYTFNFSDNTSLSCLAQTSSTDGMPVLSDNPLETINYSAGFASIFKTWGFIGDSFSSGTSIYTDDSTRVNFQFYDYSWGQCLCRLCGSTGYNFGYGGQTTTGWITKEDARSWYGAKSDPKQAYIIALGYNDFHVDYIHNQSITVGDLATDVDYSDFNNNAKTYAGNMAGIIQRLQSVNSDAYIFVVTLPREYPVYEPFNEVIRELPKHFNNVYVIDLYKYGPDYDDDFKEKYYLEDHMSAAGYQYTAYMFATYIDWIVRKNPADFRDAALR